MLDMLPPTANLQRIEVEGVAQQDLVSPNIEDAFVGVDLTEYEGGEDGRSARRIILSQIKYSPLHSEHEWTLARLTAPYQKYRRAKEPPQVKSVIGKLAIAFRTLTNELASDGQPRPEIVVRLLSNQRLDGGLERTLAALRSQVSTTTPVPDPRRQRKVRKLPPHLANVRATLLESTDISETEFDAFLLAWDTTGFGERMLVEEEASLFQALTTYVSDAGVQVGNLLSYVQERASANRRGDIRRPDVLGILRVIEADLWPAPPLFEPDEELIQTRDVRDLQSIIPRATTVELAAANTRALIDTSDASIDAVEVPSVASKATRDVAPRADVIVLHGPSGAGKTSTLRLLSRNAIGASDGPVIVLYDCFANAQGLEPRSARFPISTCFTQVANELDAILHTAVFATRRLETAHLVDRFERAVHVASRLAAAGGRRLVLAFDAVDNALDASHRAPVSGQSFVPLLWTLRWPQNCSVIVSARTENLPLIDVPSSARKIELQGFTTEELGSLGRRTGEHDPTVLATLHAQTKGNPRVATRILDLLKILRNRRHGSGTDEGELANPLSIVTKTARETAFAYYREQTPKRFESDADRATLAVLAEATQSVNVETLAQLAGRKRDDVRSLVERLAYGLRLGPAEDIVFRDQDFWDYVHEDFHSEITQARLSLASFVRLQYGSNAYAKSNLSRHLYAAGAFDELVDWWTTANRLAKAIDSASPYVERAFEDVQYALLAATRCNRAPESLKLLWLAAEVVNGRDVFLDHLANFPDVIVDLGALDEMLRTLDAVDPSAKLIGQYAALAAATSIAPTLKSETRSILARVTATRQAIRRRNERELERERVLWPQSLNRGSPADAEALWRDVFSYGDIEAEAVARANIFGSRAATKWLHNFTNLEGLGSAFAAVVVSAVTKLRVVPASARDQPAFRKAVRSLKGAIGRVPPEVEAEVTLAILTTTAGDLQPRDRGRLVKTILKRYRSNDKPMRSVKGARVTGVEQSATLWSAIESLLAARAIHHASLLAPLVRRAGPTYVHHASVRDFLRGEALNQVLGLSDFDPKAYETRSATTTEKSGEAQKTVAAGPSGAISAGDYELKQRNEREIRERDEIRLRLAGLYPAELVRARALVGVKEFEASQLLADMREVLSQWVSKAPSEEAQYYQGRSKNLFDYATVMGLLIETVVRVPKRDSNLVRDILTASDQLMEKGVDRGLEGVALTLSADERYHEQAERAIAIVRRDARPPISRPSDAVNALLNVFRAATQFDKTLASEIAREAREVANSAEAEIAGRVAGLARIADRATSRQSPPSMPAQTQTDIADQGYTKLSTATSRRLIRLFSYYYRAADNREEVDVAEILRYVARIDLAGATKAVDTLEREDVLNVAGSAVAIGLGCIDGGQVPVNAAWPLLNFNLAAAERLYKAAIKAALDRAEPFKAALVAFCTDVCRLSSLSSRGEKVSDFLRWADEIGLASDPAVQPVAAYATSLAAMITNQPVNIGSQGGPIDQSNSRTTLPGDEPTNVVRRINALVQQQPTAALEQLAACSKETFRLAATELLVETFAALAEGLPSSRMAELAGVVEKTADEYSADPFRFLEAIAPFARTTDAVNSLVSSYVRLLEPNALRVVAGAYYPHATKAALSFSLVDEKERLGLILSAVSQRLVDFDAATIHRLVGQLASLLEPPEATAVLDALTERAWEDIPADERASLDEISTEPTPVEGSTAHDISGDPSTPPPADSDLVSLLRFVADLHGHPARRVRWGAVCAAVATSEAFADPALETFVGETFDKRHRRWITKREWLLFTLECLARRQAQALAPYLAPLSTHALSIEFPHAKIRHHAKEIVLAISRHAPETSHIAEYVARVREVNVPRSSREPRDDEWVPFPARREYEARERAWPDYHFDSMDTLPYWYEPLARVFNISQDDVGDIAYEWIVRRWGINAAVVKAEWANERRGLDYGDYDHRHGSEPAVEILERYADRHGLYLAAGTLIDSMAVVNDGSREGDRWTDWARSHLREGDPALTSFLLGPAPTEKPDSYGRFSDDFDVWKKKRATSEFFEELVASPVSIPPLAKRNQQAGSKDSDPNEWVVVAARRSASFAERSFSATVHGALVSPETVNAMQRLIHDEPHRVPLPELDLGSDTILSEIEHDMRSRSDYYVSEQHSVFGSNGLFRLGVLSAEWHASFAFEDDDPRWPERSRQFLAPTNDVKDVLGLTRDEEGLSWFSPSGSLAARCEIWNDGDGSGDDSDHSDGVRLLLRRDLLLQYAAYRLSDVLLVVTRQRNRSYRYKRYRPKSEPEEPYDLGDWVAFCLRNDGAWVRVPRGRRAVEKPPARRSIRKGVNRRS